LSAKGGVGAIEDTSFSSIIRYLRLFVETRRVAKLPAKRNLNGTPFKVRMGSSNFSLANWNLPAIIFCLPSGPGWRVRSRIDVSVAAVGYRAFVFAAPPFFVAGNRSTGCKGAVSVGVVSSARGDASNIS
jgi:hypothetical protein